MGPLEGVRVLDLSRLAPGPYCTMLLADLGASVIRVDGPQTPVRRGNMLSRNKRSIVLNLKSPQGQGVLHRLCHDADVLVEGNRPGVARRLGADYETLSEINPGLVYCSLTGFGQEGPLAAEAGHDINYISIAGVLSQIGNGDAPPVHPLNLVADFGGGGLLAAFGVVCALYERGHSGRGQYIDAAMIDGAASMMAMHYATQGAVSKPGKGLLGGGAPFYRSYECRDGGYVAVGAIEPQFYASLCEVLGVTPDHDQMDSSRWPETTELFARRFQEKTRDEWARAFAGRDACVTPVLDLEEAPKHEHNQARKGFLSGPGGQFHVAPAPRFSRTPGEIHSEEPEMGAHTEEILAAAGYTAEEIVELQAQGAVSGPA